MRSLQSALIAIMTRGVIGRQDGVWPLARLRLIAIRAGHARLAALTSVRITTAPRSVRLILAHPAGISAGLARHWHTAIRRF
jgi:hypothetical protein